MPYCHIQAKKVMSDEDAQKALDVSYERFGNAGIDLSAAISRVDKTLDCLDVRSRLTSIHM